MEKRIPIPCSITMIKGSKGFETVRYRINPETSIETSTSFIKVLKAHPFNAEK